MLIKLDYLLRDWGVRAKNTCPMVPSCIQQNDCKVSAETCLLELELVFDQGVQLVIFKRTDFLHLEGGKINI